MRGAGLFIILFMGFNMKHFNTPFLSMVTLILFIMLAGYCQKKYEQSLGYDTKGVEKILANVEHERAKQLMEVYNITDDDLKKPVNLWVAK